MKKLFYVLIVLTISGCYNNDIPFYELKRKKYFECENKEYNEYVECLMSGIYMYDKEKVHLYYDSYKKSDKEKVYRCTENCYDDSICDPEFGFSKCQYFTKCESGDFGAIIEQENPKMVFMQYPTDKEIVSGEKGKIKLFQKESDSKYYFQWDPEKDSEYIRFNKVDQSATHSIENSFQKCFLQK